jgi:hypothetical protein
MNELEKFRRQPLSADRHRLHPMNGFEALEKDCGAIQGFCRAIGPYDHKHRPGVL